MTLLGKDQSEQGRINAPHCRQLVTIAMVVAPLSSAELRKNDSQML